MFATHKSIYAWLIGGCDLAVVRGACALNHASSLCWQYCVYTRDDVITARNSFFETYTHEFLHRAGSDLIRRLNATYEKWRKGGVASWFLEHRCMCDICKLEYVLAGWLLIQVEIKTAIQYPRTIGKVFIEYIMELLFA